MKQYKVLKVKIGLVNLGSEKFDSLENVMNEMSQEGWDVVCVTPEPQAKTSSVLVTFSKDI